MVVIMDQLSFSEAEYSHKKRRTRQEKILEQMEELIPWKRLENKIRKYYPQAGSSKRPYELPTMLRVHCMQLVYNLSDPAMEDVLYDIESMRRFTGLSLTNPIPDETTILNFRHLREKHGLGKVTLKEMKKHLESKSFASRRHHC